MKGKEFRLFGIFGKTLSHTLSPEMQEAALAKLGIKGFYLVLEQEEREFKQTLRRLPKSLVEGFNVTVPYKEIAFKQLSLLTPEAKAIGAVNTLYKKRGRWIGTNTDAYGFLHSLKTEGKFEPRSKSVLILGAGGSAKAVVYALAKAGAGHIAVANRTRGKAETLVTHFKRQFPKVKWQVLSIKKQDLHQAIQVVDLVVNTTSLGLKTRDKALLTRDMIGRAGRKKKLFYDLIYNPAKTKFLKAAGARGHKTLNGTGMLAAQGAKSLECWTGKKAPLKLMYRTLQDALNKR